MKKVLLMAAGLMIFSVAAEAQPNDPYPSYIMVNGNAEREVTPNEIYVGITIDESDSRSGKVTVAEQERRMITQLRNLGIDVDRDLQVGNMSGDLKSYMLRRDRVQTQKNYVLKVGNAEMLSKVFQSLSDINISKMYLIKATRSDLDQIKMELRTEAMKNAQEAARTLAEAIGQRVGKAFAITDNSYYGGGVVYYNDAMPLARAAKAEMAVSTDEASLEFQNMKINCTVNVRFVLE